MLFDVLDLLQARYHILIISLSIRLQLTMTSLEWLRRTLTDSDFDLALTRLFLCGSYLTSSICDFSDFVVTDLILTPTDSDKL